MFLNNPLFECEQILAQLTTSPPEKWKVSSLQLLQKKLKTNLFGDPKVSNDDVKTQIQNGRFKDFPSLEHVLTEIFNDKDQVVIPEGLKDWSPSVTFHELNRKYGFFEQDQDLTEIFNLLAVSGRKMTSIIENQAYDDEMAYKLMALFYDPKKSNDKNFENIAGKFSKLLRTNKDQTIATPYHDAFVVALNPFPAFSHVKDLRSWKTFIEKEGFKSLSIFSECATTQSAFANIKEANQFLLTKQYPRAHEHAELAALCKKLLIKNDGFEAGLAQVQSGWPKKETDNLPLVEIADKSGKYFWVKLPPQDMRAMYLGNLIPGCCQYINGHSKQCVIDGITLSDNGFYVMLKANSKDREKQPRLIGNEVNDKDFSIVAQSYAWKTKNGNLCLDSIEWNPDRVSTDVIHDLMSQFSEKIFEENPSIKHLTVGAGGMTPLLYSQTRFPEKMRQGSMYGDAKNQYCIASNVDDETREKLTGKLKSYCTKSQEAFLYMSPYIPDVLSFSNILAPSSAESNPDDSPHLFSLPGLIAVDDTSNSPYYQELISGAPFVFNGLQTSADSNHDDTSNSPSDIQAPISNPVEIMLIGLYKLLKNGLVMLHSPLTNNDFKRVSFSQYDNMAESAKQAVTVFCKMLNATIDGNTEKWLPTIPKESLSIISVQSCNFNTKAAYIKCLENPKDKLKFFSKWGMIQGVSNSADELLELLPKEYRLSVLLENDRSIANITNTDIFEKILKLLPDQDKEKAREKYLWSGLLNN